MKKVLMILLSLLLVAGLAGCDTNKPKDVSISSNWKDLEFIMGKEKYSFPLFFKDFANKGWSLEGDDDLSPGEYTDYVYILYNDAFYDSKQDQYAFVYVDFENYGDKVQSIRKCNIWCVSLYRVDDLGNIINNCYEIELAKGIKWGSTKQEIISAYGEPVDETANEYNGITYVILRYLDNSNNENTIMYLYVFDNGGLSIVDLMRYPLEE